MNLAQLVVSLTSDTGSFVAGMRKAASETATFEATVKRAQRQGLDPMMARLGSAAQGAQAWDAGMRNMAASTAAATASAVKGAGAFTALRSPLTALTATLIGVPGPLGNIASLLGSFAVGAGPIVAAVAGIGAVAAAWLHFTKAAREAGHAAQEAGERWSKSKERAELKEQIKAMDALVAARQRMIEQLRTGRKEIAGPVTGVSGGGRWETLTEQGKADLERKIREAVEGEHGIGNRSQRIAELKWIISPSAATIASAQATGRQLAQAVADSAKSWWEDDRGWMQGMGEGMVPTIPDTSIAPIHRGGRDPFGPNQGGESPYAEWMRKQQEAAEASQHFVDAEAARTAQWQDAWLSAAQASAGAFASFIDQLIDGSLKAEDILKNLAKLLLRLILNAALGGLAGGGGGGGGLPSSGGGGLALRGAGGAGATYNTTNIYHVQAIDAKSVAELLMSQRHTIALANGRAMSESRSLSRMNRGW